MTFSGNTKYICPVCGKEWIHNAYFDKYVEKQKSHMEHAVGFRISTPMYKPLCESCKEWLLYLATEGLLDQQKIDILRGTDDKETETTAQEE